MCFRAFIARVLVPGILLYAGMASADVLDGGEVRFGGKVTDEGPRWIWQMGESDPVWAVDTASAQTVGSWLVFDLSNKGTLPFLEGRLHEVAGQGGPGFSPQVTFSSQGKSLLLSQEGGSNRGRFQAAVPVTDQDTGRPVGQLAFMVEQGLAASFRVQPPPEGTDSGPGFPSGMSILTGGTVMQLPTGGLSQGLMNRLSALLLLTPGWEHGMSAAYRGRVVPQSVLNADTVTDIAAAYASSLSGFQLTLPAEQTPAGWLARISVTVTVQ